MDGSTCKESPERSSEASDNNQETDTGFSGKSKRLSQKQEKIITDAKGIRHFFGRRSSENDSVCTASPSSRSFVLPQVADHLCQYIGRPPGEKRPFLCWVSYKKQKFRIRGAVDDVHSMRDFLFRKYNFPLDSVPILSETTHKPPTRKNIEDGFKWLTRDLQFGDSFVIYYPGHGLQQPEVNGDEN